MRLGVLLVALLGTYLTVATGATALAQPPAGSVAEAPPAAIPIRSSPPRPEPLGLAGIAVEPRWDHTTAGTVGTPVTLAVELRLAETPHDWVQISVQIPPGWKAMGQREGWTSCYFLSSSRTISFELELQELGQTDTASEFPVLVQTGGRTGWLRLYLQAPDHGFCAAVARVDEHGRPLWFTGESADGSDRAYWSLRATVSEALAFVGRVLDVEIHPPAYLSPWCGLGTRSHSPGKLIEAICQRAGCVIERSGAGGYLLDFAPGYTGGPDASWFVGRRAASPGGC